MSQVDTERIAALEWANYAAMQGVLQATPGSRLVLRDDVILSTARLFPGVEMNHACLLRAAPGASVSLLDEIVAYFRLRRLPAAVCLSPACTPAGWEGYLLERGFCRQERVESWLTLDIPPGWLPPPLAASDVLVTRVSKADARSFARPYLATFGLPGFLAPLATPLLKRTMDLPNAHYYVAFVAGKPAGVSLWLGHEHCACLGGAGVLPAYRGRRVITTLLITAVTDAQRQGMDTVLAQTSQEALVSVACKYGFRQVFTRTRYVL